MADPRRPRQDAEAAGRAHAYAYLVAAAVRWGDRRQRGGPDLARAHMCGTARAHGQKRRPEAGDVGQAP